MKPPNKYLKLDQVIDVLLNDTDEEDENIDNEDEENEDDIEESSNKNDDKSKQSEKIINKLVTNEKEKEANNSSDNNNDLLSSKLIVKKSKKQTINNKNNKLENKKITKNIRVPSRQQSKVKLIKHSSTKKEKHHLELNFLKGIFDFDSLNENLQVDDANLSIVYSDMDESINFDNSNSTHSSDFSQDSDNDTDFRHKNQNNDDKENIPRHCNSKSISNKSPILILQNTNQFLISSKNPKRKH